MRRTNATIGTAAAMVAVIAAAGCARGRTGSSPADADLPGRGAQEAEGETMAELFVGKFPGVQVYSQPGGGISLRIRGAGTIHNRGEPLIVIDGSPVLSGNGGLLFLNAADIETIEVLKDMSSLSYYGIHGANGVVLITTKRRR